MCDLVTSVESFPSLEPTVQIPTTPCPAYVPTSEQEG